MAENIHVTEGRKYCSRGPQVGRPCLMWWPKQSQPAKLGKVLSTGIRQKMFCVCARLVKDSFSWEAVINMKSKEAYFEINYKYLLTP